MKVAIISKVVHSADHRTHKCTWEFVENGHSKHIVEVEILNNATKAIMIRNIIQGKFGSMPQIYKWLNRPETTVKGNTTIKKNHWVL